MQGDKAICFDCGCELDHESSHGRDTETMGGYSVQYYKCPECEQHYKMILDNLDGDILCMTDKPEHENWD